LPYLGENDDILHDHLKRAKIKVKNSGINVNSREVVCILVDYFAGRLGKWVSGRPSHIRKLNIVGVLVGYVRGDLTIVDLKVRQII
jgi:hypothetical protein